MKRISIVVLLFCGVLMFISCGNDNSRKIVDQMNREIFIKENPEKVLCLSPAMGEWMFKLGLGDKIVGRNSLCTYPEEMKSKTDVGLVFLLDTNMIKTLQPDIVLSNSQLPKKWRQWFEEKDIDLILFNGGNKVEDIYPALTLLGKIFHKEADVNNIIAQYKKEIADIESKPLDPKPRTYFAMKFAGDGSKYGGEDMTATKDHLFGDIMRIAGVNNIAANYKSMSMVRADVVRSNPEYIIVYASEKEDFCSKGVYQNMDAVKNNKVIGIDKDFLQELSPRNLDAIKYIRQIISDNEKN